MLAADTIVTSQARTGAAHHGRISRLGLAPRCWLRHGDRDFHL